MQYARQCYSETVAMCVSGNKIAVVLPIADMLSRCEIHPSKGRWRVKTSQPSIIDVHHIGFVGRGGQMPGLAEDVLRQGPQRGLQQVLAAPLQPARGAQQQQRHAAGLRQQAGPGDWQVPVLLLATGLVRGIAGHEVRRRLPPCIITSVPGGFTVMVTLLPALAAVQARIQST